MDSNNIFGGLTKEQVTALLATIGDPAELQDIQTQQDAADKLRADRPAGGRMVGNTYVADINALLGPMINGYAARNTDQFLKPKRDKIYAKHAQGAQDFLNGAYGNQQPPPIVGGGALRGY